MSESMRLRAEWMRLMGLTEAEVSQWTDPNRREPDSVEEERRELEWVRDWLASSRAAAQRGHP